MKIGNFPINQGRTFVIAEIGGNHEGDFRKAKQMVCKAAEAGADAVKFQILRADHLVASGTSKRAYSGISHKAQLDRFKSREFTFPQYQELRKVSEQCGVAFFASVFDLDLIDQVDSLVPAYKVASGDVTYRSMLEHIRKKRKPILVSTGASTLSEIRRVIRWIGKKDLVILHCICSYPAPDDEMNLLSIPFMKEKLNVPIGFSDHSVGIYNSIAAVALGACVIEKHFTLDPGIPFGDHKLSVTPDQLKEMVRGIRVVEKALGKLGRPLMNCEKKSRDLVRRSLYANTHLKKGKTLGAEDWLALRPLEGIPVENEKQLQGKKIKKTVRKGVPLTPNNVSGKEMSTAKK